MNKGIKTENRMQLAHFHDFYVLQAIEAKVSGKLALDPELQFSKKVDKFLEQLENVTERIVSNMALRTFVYLYAACMGEARHARDNVARERFIKQIDSSRSGVFSTINQYPPDEKNVGALVNIFAQEWRGGYGGTAWHKIAEALTEYKTMPDAAWLDHVVDLEHNNGTAFSKPDGFDTIMFSSSYDGRFSSFLNYKFEHDILTSNQLGFLAVSPRVHNLLSKFCTVFGEKMPTHLFPGLENLSDYEAEWGHKHIESERKWREWYQIEKVNKPTAKWAVFRAGIHSINMPELTITQAAKKLTEIKRVAIINMGEYASSYQKSKIKRLIDKKMKEAEQYCKLEKAKVTYSVLPFKVVFHSYKELTLEFYLPYQGIGEQTEYGFKITGSPIYSTYFQDGKYVDGYIEKEYGIPTITIGEVHTYYNNNKLEALLD